VPSTIGKREQVGNSLLSKSDSVGRVTHENTSGATTAQHQAAQDGRFLPLYDTGTPLQASNETSRKAL
jgi:hypothetical protein